MNKKGIFFTVLIISLLSLFLITYSISTLTEDRVSINKRVDTMNNFVSLLEEDLPRKLHISGFRILFLLENDIVKDGEYVPDVQAAFEECFKYGTIDGELQDPSMIEGILFEDIQDNLNETAGSVNLNFNLSSPEIYISQDDPWNVKITFIADLLIQDSTGLAQWNRSFYKDVYIPVTNFFDPVYLLETGGLVENKINQSIFQGNFISEAGDTSNLEIHLENSNYIASTSAPSFLDRLEGNFNPNPNGIESTVNLVMLSSQGVPTVNKSVIDYIYFDESNNPTPICKVDGMPSWFLIDDEDNHREVYNVTGTVLGTCYT